MPGTLHIFRLKADPPQYQANYNLAARSYVQAFDTAGIEEFLLHSSSLPLGEVNALLEELRSNGHTRETVVDLAESHLGVMGFTESPSDR